MSRWGTGPARLAAALAAIGLAACAPATPIPRGDNAVCAGLFDQLEQMEHTPFSGGPGYDFLSAQLARIRQADCITFTNDLSGMEATGTALLPHVPPTGPQLQPSVAVQAGVVTNRPTQDARSPSSRPSATAPAPKAPPVSAPASMSRPAPRPRSRTSWPWPEKRASSGRTRRGTCGSEDKGRAAKTPAGCRDCRPGDVLEPNRRAFCGPPYPITALTASSNARPRCSKLSYWSKLAQAGARSRTSPSSASARA